MIWAIGKVHWIITDDKDGNEKKMFHREIHKPCNYKLDKAYTKNYSVVLPILFGMTEKDVTFKC